MKGRTVARLDEPCEVGADDERELRFDVDQLASGDPVAVWFACEHRWIPGVFSSSKIDGCWIEFARRERIQLDEALAGGLKRILH